MEYEKAISLFLKLRVLINANKSYSPIREHLRGLIKEFETNNWSSEDTISTDQIIESDAAENRVQAETEFNQKRKDLIKSKLKSKGLNQNDLALILGHKKGYMSELINGLRPFSKDDLVIINKLFKIKFEDLIPCFIQEDRALHIKKTLKSLSDSNLKLIKNDLEFQMA